MEQYNPEQLVERINELGKDFNVTGSRIHAESNPEYKNEEYSIGITFSFNLDGFHVFYEIEKNNFVKPGLTKNHSTSEKVTLRNKGHHIFFRRNDGGINSIGIGSRMYLSDNEGDVKIREIMEKSYKIIRDYLHEKTPMILTLAQHRPVPRGKGKGLDGLIGELEDVRKNQ